MIQSNATLGEGAKGLWTKQSFIKQANLSHVNMPHIIFLAGQDVQSTLQPAAMLHFCLDNIKRNSELGPYVRVSGTALSRQLPRHCNSCMAAPQ